MNVSTITMPHNVAYRKMMAYRAGLKRRSDEQWSVALEAYQALDKGTTLVDPFKAIHSAGWDEQGRPRLAIARADRKRVRFDKRTDYAEFNSGARDRWSKPETKLRIDVPMPAYPAGGNRAWEAEAIIPMIPADVYPARGYGTRKDWFILWEADWKAAPVDPMLLKHVAGTLYAVLAQWDLTEIERSILEGDQ